MLTVLSSLLFTVCLVLVFRFVNKKHKPPIFGIYQRKNKYYYFKFTCMYVLLKIRQLYAYLKPLLDVEMGRSADGTSHVHQRDATLEKKYFLGDDPLAVDAIYFNGMSKEGEAVICGISRRQGYFCDAFLMLKVNGEELLLSPALPDTYLNQETIEQGEYRAQGIQAVNFIPMRTWNLTYDGDMKSRNATDLTVKVKVDLTWSAQYPPFIPRGLLPPCSLAADIAREPWSRGYFKMLKRLHETRYEQMGYIKGTVTLGDQEHTLHMPSVREHSFGPFRDWRVYHRYVVHYIFLENGDCINLNVISKPTVLSHITVGYVCRNSDNQKLFPIDWCDFQLYEHGENQIMPKDYGFMFKAGKRTYEVLVKVSDEEPLYMGKDREAQLYERWSTVEVNGVKGWAVVEWQYNNLTKTQSGKRGS